MVKATCIQNPYLAMSLNSISTNKLHVKSTDYLYSVVSGSYNPASNEPRLRSLYGTVNRDAKKN